MLIYPFFKIESFDSCMAFTMGFGGRGPLYLGFNMDGRRYMIPWEFGRHDTICLDMALHVFFFFFLGYPLDCWVDFRRRGMIERWEHSTCTHTQTQCYDMPYAMIPGNHKYSSLNYPHFLT